MDLEMAVAIATPLVAGGWFAFKVVVWRREEAERLAKARAAEAAKSEAAREAEAAKSEAAFKAIDGRLGALERGQAALERGQAAIIAELGGIKGTMERFFRTREADLKEANEKREADLKEANEKREADLKEANEKREADRSLLMELKAEMAGFKSSLDGLYRLHREGMEVHSREIAALGARIGALEEKAGRLEEKVDGLEGELAALRAEFVEFREAVMPRARPAGAAP